MSELTQVDDILFIKSEIIKINKKLDEIIKGPIFREHLTMTGNMEAKVNDNMRRLNDMLLQVKGIVSQVSSLRGRKSDWFGKEISSEALEGIKYIE